MKDCTKCIHIEVCAYVSHELPPCDSYEEPVKHGRWVRAAAYSDGVINTAYCSACRDFLPVCAWDNHKYCPNCGAKMDLEE